MDATVAFLKVGASEGGGSKTVQDRSARDVKSADPFENVLKGASEAREAMERSDRRELQTRRRDEVRSEDRDVDAVDAEGGEEKVDEEQDEQDGKVDEDRQPDELVVEGGINLVLPSAGNVQDADGDRSAGVDGNPGVTASSADDGAADEAQARLAAAQAKAQAEAQSRGGQAEADSQTQETEVQVKAPDRGAAARAAIEGRGADAKEEPTNKQRPSSEASARNAARSAASESAARVEQMLQALGGADEAPPEAKQAQAQAQAQVQSQPQVHAGAGAERADSVQAAAGMGRVEARAEGTQGSAASHAEKPGEPAVDRQQLTEQVVRSARLNLERGTSRFEMRLDPPSLGRLKVTMDLKDGSLNISFRAENHAVRDALQNSLPQLREALAGQGLSLDGFDVQSSGQGAHGQGEARQESGFGGEAPGGSDSGPWMSETAAPQTAATETVRAGNGLVDRWA